MASISFVVERRTGLVERLHTCLAKLRTISGKRHADPTHSFLAHTGCGKHTPPQKSSRHGQNAVPRSPM
eukprot:993512-Pelagomonas_calceolata.AAC.3